MENVRLIKVYPYRSAQLQGKTVFLPRVAMAGCEELVRAAKKADNHIVAVFRCDDTWGVPREFYVAFSDMAAHVGNCWDSRVIERAW